MKLHGRALPDLSTCFRRHRPGVVHVNIVTLPIPPARDAITLADQAVSGGRRIGGECGDAGNGRMPVVWSRAS